MEFSSWKTYVAMFGGLGLVVAAAIVLFLVIDPVSGSAQPASPIFVSQSGTISREQPSPVSFVRAAPTAGSAVTQVPGPIDHTPPTVTYFVAPDADQSVKDALADGVVTFDEYTQAVNNTMACLDEKGAGHSKPVYNEDRVQYDYGVVSTTGPGGVSAYDDCWMRYERDVQSAWVQANEHLKRYEPVNEKGALECAAKFGLKATTFQDIVELKRAHPKDPAIQSCYVIGLMGYDPSVQSRP